ncbi:MAG: Mur ligase family protein [Rhizobiaceae bacterium]|nr:Mur ligase family protein [Rhizobiaceae bacterium]
MGALRRSFARFDQIIAVTGSVAKSSTTGLIGALMRSQGRTLVGQNFNGYRAIVVTLASSAVMNRYWVQEVSGDVPGAALKAAGFLRQTVAVVTRVGADHINNFSSVDDIAREKANLVATLPQSGLAVLNADDLRVFAMRFDCQCRVITYGCSQNADIRAIDWREGLPGRLSIQVREGGQEVTIQTRLIGARWITSILAAIAVGRGMGISLEECARVMAEIPPFHYRDSVHILNNGTTIVLDTHKRAFWTVESSLDIVRKATYPRKTVVFGQVGYYVGAEHEMYREIIEQALDVADRIVIYGKLDDEVHRILEEYPGRVFYFDAIAKVQGFLKANAVAGELIYVKAGVADNLERLWYDTIEPIKCWQDRCGKRKTCDRCNDLYGSRWARFYRFSWKKWTR